MKKKNLLALLSVILAAVCLFALAACNNNDNDDKSFNNIEFSEYREKVISVLKDNDIFVNDIGENGKTKRSAVSSDASAAPAAYPENADSIHDIIMSGNPISDYESVKSDRDSIFEQSLYISLIIGDALSNYHNVTSFYNIPVYFEIWNQYFEIVKKGNSDLVRVYTPANESNEDTVLTMELRYNSVSDYSFTCIQIEGAQTIYAYGNSAKRYVRITKDIRSDLQGVDSGIYYIPSDGEGYIVTDADVVDRCYNMIKDETETIDKKPIIDIKDKVKYTVTSAQGTQTMSKYFGNDKGQETGIQFDGSEKFNGKKVAIAYVADESSTVELPDNEEYYISSNFNVWDSHGNVNELVIPQNVLGFVAQRGNGYIAAELDNIHLGIYVDLYNNGNGTYEIFDKFTVKDGSPFFKSGEGHLYTTSGQVICVADYPLEQFDLDILSATSDYIDSYKNLFKKIERIDIDTDKLYNPEYDDFSNIRIIEKAIQSAPNLSDITIASKRATSDRQAYFSLEVEPRKNINISLDVSGNTVVALNFKNTAQTAKTVAITVENLPRNCQGSIQLYYTGNISASVSLDMTEQYYNAFYYKCIYSENKNIPYNFKSAGAEESGFNGMNITPSLRDSLELAVKIDSVENGAEIRVPNAYCGADITEVQLNCDVFGDKTAKVYLPKNISSMSFYTMNPTEEQYNDFYIGTLQNPNLTLAYSGTYEQFGYLYLRHLEGRTLSFTVQCSDGTHSFTHTDGNHSGGELEYYNVNIDVFGDIITQQITKGTKLNYYPEYWNFEDGYAYFLSDGQGNYTFINKYESYTYNPPEIIPERDNMTYTLVRMSYGSYNEEYGTYQTEYLFNFNGEDVTVNLEFIVTSYTEIRFSLSGNGIYDYGHDFSGEQYKLILSDSDYTLTISGIELISDDKNDGEGDKKE